MIARVHRTHGGYMSQVSIEMTPSPTNASRRYVMAALLLDKWMREEPDYDDRVWSVLEQELKDDSLRCHDADESGS